MILLALAGVGAAFLAYQAYQKYHTASATVAAVKAEIAKIEAEVVTVVVNDEASIKSFVTNVTTRIKALL